MSDVPFGFTGGAGGGDDEPRGAQDPFAALFGAGGDIGAAFTRIGELLSWSGGPVNWDLARDLARQTAAASNDRFVGEAQRDEVVDAMRLAELWLDPVTSFASGATRTVAWSRAEWIEATLPAWRALVEPVAARVVEAMATTIGQANDGSPGVAGLGALGLPAIAGLPGAGDLSAMTGPVGMGGSLGGVLRSLGGAMFGAQVGQAIGSLAGEVVGSTDVGLPLGPTGTAALLPANVAAFGEGLGVGPDQVRFYLALREAAYHRLFAHATWLRSRLEADVEAYAKGITIDTSRLEEAMGRLDPSDPAALQEALGADLFAPQNTPEQQHVLARLEGLLALVEGWVDEVVDAAATPHLPAAAALRETVRRRRATGGPAEQAFAALVGLELRPRRLRDAATLWQRVTQVRGPEGRDAVWSHPDLMPSVEDLDDPDGFAGQSATADWDISALDAKSATGESAGETTGESAGESNGESTDGDGTDEDGVTRT